MRAQQHHPQSQKLYFTFFQIELENKRKSEEKLALERAKVVYTNVRKKFTDLKFFIEILSIADRFAYASSIQKTILDDMREFFPREELLWHTLAQRELNGLSTNDCSVHLSDVKEEDEDSKPKFGKLKMIDTQTNSNSQSLRKRIELCVQIYDAAVTAVSSNFQ